MTGIRRESIVGLTEYTDSIYLFRRRYVFDPEESVETVSIAVMYKRHSFKVFCCIAYAFILMVLERIIPLQSGQLEQNTAGSCRILSLCLETRQ